MLEYALNEYALILILGRALFDQDKKFEIFFKSPNIFINKDSILIFYIFFF